MFRGFRAVNLDSKGRLAVPSRFRERLRGTAGGCLVQTISPLDRVVRLYPLSEWELVEARLVGLSDFDKQGRRTKQMMLGHATECRLDAHGRILVQPELRDYAGLNKEAVILGQGNKFEIWSRQAWGEQREDYLDSVGAEESAPSAALQSLSL